MGDAPRDPGPADGSDRELATPPGRSDAEAMGMLAASWARCWSALQARGDGQALRDQLIAAYREPQRHYHTLQHLSECLGLFAAHRDLAADAAEVEIALWFHDAVYQVRAGDNEDRSADWAAAALNGAGVAPDRVARVRELILATRHAAQPLGQDQTLLTDIDLAILGAPRPRFEDYEAQVRAEYHWVPLWLFRRKRRDILAGFLARPSIYGTPSLRARFETRARDNLARALDAAT